MKRRHFFVKVTVAVASFVGLALKKPKKVEAHDFQNLTCTKTTNASLNVPRWILSGKLVNSQTGVVIRDFTGANTQMFPNVLGNLTAAQQQEFVEMSVQWLIYKFYNEG